LPAGAAGASTASTVSAAALRFLEFFAGAIVRSIVIGEKWEGAGGRTRGEDVRANPRSLSTRQARGHVRGSHVLPDLLLEPVVALCISTRTGARIERPLAISSMADADLVDSGRPVFQLICRTPSPPFDFIIAGAKAQPIVLQGD
jgi:hypothetical protein